ncbi:MAG: DNA-binding response regulator, partial [Hungatella sp.]
GVRYYVLKPTNFSELKEIFGNIKSELDTKYQVDPEDHPNTSSDEIIQTVLNYCSQNYKDGSLSALAESLYLNPSYLSQFIKQKTSKTFSDPDAKIYNISTMIGYVNPNNFARAFKAYWGVPPSGYRNHDK